MLIDTHLLTPANPFKNHPYFVMSSYIDLVTYHLLFMPLTPRALANHNTVCVNLK